MKKLNFDFKVKDELGNYIPVTVGQALVGGLKRFDSRDEHTIRKIEVFIENIQSGDFELDEADVILFKELALNTDLAQVIKIEVMKMLDKIK